jgi:hypothetical protein
MMPMADAITATPADGKTPQWNEKLVDFALRDPVRRRILLALSHGKPLAASQLTGSSRRSVDGTYKQLVQMRSKGFILMKPDLEDRRRTLCTLSPSVPVVTTPTGKVMDFGFIAIPLSS